jgi:uncharacterized damage-inducible protein DinB
MADRYFATLARYNQWANARLYDACARLPDAELRAPRAAFFGSLLGTLNHVLVGDRLWMGRVAGKPESLRLDQILHEDFAELHAARAVQDAMLVALVDGLDTVRLDRDLTYQNTKGETSEMPLRMVLGHVFNHQTHHRGQAHDLLTQTIVAPPELDLIIFARAKGGYAA